MTDAKNPTVAPAVHVDDKNKTVAPDASPVAQPVKTPEATPVKQA